MSFEQIVGGGSVGEQPNYAAQDWQIQQQQAHRFDDFTNPFLFAQNVNKSVMPWIENKQNYNLNQAKLDIAQKQQDLAETEQNTLLPLKAQQLGVQTSNMQAQGAAASYALNRAQTADASAPEFFKQFGTAINNGDKVGAYNAIANYPDVTAKYAQQIQSGMADLDKNSIIHQGVGIQSATQQGAVAAANQKFPDPQSYGESLTPQANESQSDFLLRQSAAQQGFAQKQSQIQQIQAQSQSKLALAKIQAGGRVDSATVRTVGDLIKNGNMAPDEVEAVAPGLAAWSQAHPGEEFNGPLNAMASPYPKQTQQETMQNYRTILASPNASEQDKASVRAQMHQVFPAFASQDGGSPNVDPVNSAYLSALDTADKAAQLKAAQAAASPTGHDKPLWGIFGGQSPYDEAIGTINRIKMERANFLQNQTQQSSPQATPLKQTSASNAPAQLAASGNPLTAAAVQSTQTNATPAASAPVQMNPKDQQAMKWAKANPNDPRSAKWLEALKAKYGQ